MRHRKDHRHLSRTSSHRQAMFSNMLASLFKLERISTTDCKAKELRGVAEKLITAAKHGARLEAEAKAAPLKADQVRLQAQAIHKRRIVSRTLRDAEALKKLFGELQERYAARPGGYTRIFKVGQRHGDAAPISLLELVDRQVPEQVVEAKTGAKKTEDDKD